MSLLDTPTGSSSIDGPHVQDIKRVMQPITICHTFIHTVSMYDPCSLLTCPLTPLSCRISYGHFVCIELNVLQNIQCIVEEYLNACINLHT